MILVAGATGNLGPSVVERLAAHGKRVRVLTRDAARARKLFGPDVEVMAGDLTLPSSLIPALDGVATVVSAATGFGPGGAGPMAVDLRGSKNLIAAAEAASVQHFVLLSMHGAGAEHPLELYRAKFFAEERLRNSRLAWTIIRPTVFMELWADIVGTSLNKSGKATVFGRGENPINLVSVRDVARFVELAVVDPRLRGLAINLGGPENLTLNDVVEIMAAGSGRPAVARHIPLMAMRAGSVLMRPFRPDLARLIRAAVLMDTADMSLDSRELAERHPEIHLTRLVDVGRRKLRPA